MSIAEDEDDSPGRTRPRSIRFTALPRQPLDQGKGTTREIWAEPANDLNLRWQLRLVEIKDSTGLLVGPAGTHHHVVGLAGPQVAVRNTDTSRVLRRDHVLPVLSNRVHFERSNRRPPGASSVIVLSFAAAVEPPGFFVQRIDVGADLRAGAQVLVALRGTVLVDGADAAPGSALLLDPAQSYRARASSAHVLTVHRPGALEDAPG
jgi:hypothetical protein